MPSDFSVLNQAKVLLGPIHPYLSLLNLSKNKSFRSKCFLRMLLFTIKMTNLPRNGKKSSKMVNFSMNLLLLEEFNPIGAIRKWQDSLTL